MAIKTYSAIWGFKEDILKLRKNFVEHILKAHTSQPIGIPLHAYRGTITIDDSTLFLSGRHEKSGRTFQLLIQKKKILDVHLGWDDVLRRWRDTRAWIRPLRITFKNGDETKILYIYAKKQDGKVYGRENENLYNNLAN